MIHKDYFIKESIIENNGHTPHEIYELVEKPNLRPLPEKPFKLGGSNGIDMKTREKIGRNDLCSWGSINIMK